MKVIKDFVFAVRCQPVDTIFTGFRTIKLTNQPTYHEWCLEFNVSMLYDRKAVYLD